MSLGQKLNHELKTLAMAGLYFGTWITVLLLLKDLILTEYSIAFHGWSMALLGTMVLSKVVLTLEHVSLGDWVQTRPAWVDVLLRTALYTLGVAVVLTLEKAFEGRHEHGGFVSSLTSGFRQIDAHHIWLNTICLSGAVLGYNVLSVVRRHLGEGGLLRLFLRPLPREQKPWKSGSPAPTQGEK